MILSSLSLAEQQKAPVAQGGYSGQWRIGEPLPLGRHGTGFEAEPFRAAQHLGDADRRRPELMTDLLGIDPDPLKTQQHDQRGKTRDQVTNSFVCRSRPLRLNFAN